MRATATEVKNNFGRYLKISANEEIIITKNGKDIACLNKYNPDAKNKFLVCEGSAAYSSLEPFKASYDEYLRLVEDSTNRYEYINGTIYLLASPSHFHQSVLSNLHVRFYNWFEDKKCRSLFAPYDVNIQVGEDKNTVQPDILVICDEEKVDEKGRYHGVPSLIVEVLSPSTKSKDMIVKLELYMKGGVDEFWMIDVEERYVYVYSFNDKKIDHLYASKRNETVKSIRFKGLEINVDDMFKK